MADENDLSKSICTETADFSEFDQTGGEMPEDWSPCVNDEEIFILKEACGCKHALCNGKEKHLHNGVKRAREVLRGREKVLDKTTATMSTFDKTVFSSGVFIAAMGCPVIGLGVAAVSIGMEIINNRTKKAVDVRFSETYQALDICDSKDAAFDSKQEAYITLKKAARHVRYWENSSYIMTTVVKFAVAEVAMAIDIFMAAFDAKDEMRKQFHPPKISSKILTGAVGEIHKGLGLPHKHTTPPNPSPQ